MALCAMIYTLVIARLPMRLHATIFLRRWCNVGSIYTMVGGRAVWTGQSTPAASPRIAGELDVKEAPAW